jgi:Flp pilus assembly CpaE family ATPase
LVELFTFFRSFVTYLQLYLRIADVRTKVRHTVCSSDGRGTHYATSFAPSAEDDPMKDLSIVIFAADAREGAGMSRVLEGIANLRVVDVVCSDLATCLAQDQPDAFFVALGSSPHRTLDMLDALPADKPPFFLTGDQEDTSVLLRSMRMGVIEFIADFEEKSILTGLAKLPVMDVEEAVEEAVVKQPGSVIAVMGAKGGVGATVVGCQLAAGLQELGGSVAIVDLGHPLGDVSVHYDLQPSSALANIASGQVLDGTWIKGAMQAHRSGVKVLASPSRAEDSERIVGGHVSSLIPALQKEFDWVVLELSHAWTDASVRALDMADLVLLVTLLDVPTLNHARKRLDLLRRLGHPSSKVRLLANRYERQNAIDEREVSEFLGRVPDARLPNDYATVARGINQGRLVSEVARKSPLHRAYRDLACEVHGWCGREEPELIEAEEPRPLAAIVRGTFRKKNRPTQVERPGAVLADGARPYQVLTVTSNKGGVAKTTVATNLAVYFRALREDLPILVVGFDDQSMIDRMFALNSEVPEENVVNAMRDGSLSSAIRLGQYGVHYVATSPDVSDLKGEIDDVFRLREILRETNWNGLVILDTKSDFEILTRNAIAASDLSVVVVHDHTSLLEAKKVYDFIERLGRSRDHAKVLLSLVDRRIKFQPSEDADRIDILAHLVSEVRKNGYPLFESFISRSPKVEALYTNPFGRAISILHGAQESLIHLQMSHLAKDILETLDVMKASTEVAAVHESEREPLPILESSPTAARTPGATPAPAAVPTAMPPSRPRWGRSFWGRKRDVG